MKRILFLLIFCSFGFAETILIPEDFATIQAGINASVDGDTVLVAAGTYVENVNLSGKSIVIIGDGQETTIIDGAQNGRVITFDNPSNQDASSILKGFTIKNGSGNYGINANSANYPVFKNLILENNLNYHIPGNATVENSIFQNNTGEILVIRSSTEP